MKLGAKCKYCRRFGQKVGFNERCLSHKCALSRRRTRPGMHGKKLRKLSLYGRQLLEKQRLKISYLINEKQMKRYVEMAKKMNKPAPEALIEILERRLDNVVWRAGYVPNKTTARQLVSHGHFLVNGRRVKTPSYLVEPGDIIEIRPQSRDIQPFKDLSERTKNFIVPSWLKVDPNTFKTEVLKLPQYNEIPHNFNLGLVIDFYSR
ncbi:MAG: 30S ribosomal protein S4 [Patescibacteria group bacterium]